MANGVASGWIWVLLIVLGKVALGQEWKEPMHLYSGHASILYPTYFHEQQRERIHALITVPAYEYSDLYLSYLERFDNISGVLEVGKHNLFTSDNSMMYLQHEDTYLIALGMREGLLKLDIYYTMAKASTLSWTNPIKLDHPADDASRLLPTLLYNNATKRLWLFYWRMNEEEQHGCLCYVTRPLDSSVFTPEKTIATDIKLSSQNIRALLHSQDKEGLQVFLTGRKTVDQSDFLVSVRTDNNGLTWSYNRLFEVKGAIVPRPLDCATSPTNPKELSVVTLDEQAAHTQLLIANSHDGGNSWSMFRHHDYNFDVTELSCQYCRWVNQEGLMLFYCTQASFLAFSAEAARCGWMKVK